MAHLRDTTRRWIGLAVACAVLSLAVTVQARQSATALPQAQAMALALGDQPMDAAQLALGRRLTQAMTFDTSLASGLDLLLSLTRGQVLAGLPANAPTERKAVFTAALDEALAGVKVDMMAKLNTGYSRYFAASMTPATLAELTTFYESPLGRKMEPGSPALSDADTQAVGQYSMDHPAIPEGIAAMVGSATVSQEIMKREQGAMARTFKVRFCQSLKTRGASPPSCVGVG